MAKRGSAEVLSRNGLRCFLAELLGTFLLVLIGCMGCLEGWPSGAPIVTQYSISFGMVVMFVVQIMGHVSGAHVNPAVTVCAILYKTLSISMGLVYFVAQMFGSVAGYGVLLILTPNESFNNSTAFCVTMPSPLVSSGQAVIVETIITMVLIFVCCAVWDPCNSNKHDSVPIKFGFTIAAICMSAGAYTGASMNPARSFGPALWANKWDSHWVYWIGPLLGSVLATLIYCHLLKKEQQPTQREEVPLNEVSK